MARNYRDIFEEGEYYHIYNKVVSNTLLFRKEDDYEDFKKRIKKYFGHYFEIMAFCLIPNHFHLLVKVRSPNLGIIKSENTNAAIKFINATENYNFFLENQFSRMLSGYTLKHNLKYARCGPLLKEGTKRVRLKTEQRIIQQLCYIHHNPIHHFIVDEYSDWNHSSYNNYKMADPNKLISHSTTLHLIKGMKQFDEIHFEFQKDFIYEEK